MDERNPNTVEVLITGPGLNDSETFVLPDEKAGRAFARSVMQFAYDRVNPKPGRTRKARTAESAS